VWQRANVLAASVGCFLLAGCSGLGSAAGTTTQPTPIPQPRRPSYVIPAPQSVVSAADPMPTGKVWLLAGNQNTKGVYHVNLATRKIVHSTSVSNAASSIAESSSGLVALGLATPKSGAVQVLGDTRAAVIRTVAMPAPVTAVAPGSDGTTFYVLHKTARAAGVTIFDAQRGLREGSIPVPLDTVAFVSTASQQYIYCLESSGLVSQTSITDGRLTSQFSVAGTGRSLALSPDTGTLYVLKGIGPVRNVAVVKLATQSVVKVLPAPADAEIILRYGRGRVRSVRGAVGYPGFEPLRPLYGSFV
jgi:hypothetical protein